MKILLTILILAAACGAAQAGIEWTWANGAFGSEQGTFITNGELVAEEAPSGSYTIIDFSITATAYLIPIGSMSGGEFDLIQPDIGFDWDGSAPTVFWRNSGGYTNGLWMHVTAAAPDDPAMIGMGMGWFTIVDEEDDFTFHYDPVTPILTPVGNVTAHERATFGAVKALYR